MLRKKKAGKTERKPKTGGRIPLTYYRSRSKEQEGDSPFEKKTKKRRLKLGSFFSRTLDIFLLSAIAAAIVYSLIVQPQPKVELSSDVYHSFDDYQKAVTAQLKKINNRNKISFDEGGVIKTLKQQFPEISQADVILPVFGEKPTVVLTVAQPAFWLVSGGQKYVINNSGTAVVLARNLPDVSRLVTVTDQSGYSAQVGKQVLSSGQVNFIETVIKQLQNAKVPVAGITLPPKAQEMDVRTSDRAYYVKFYLGGDPLLQSGQFLAARHQFDLSGHQPGEYLDVRVNGKIYFR